MLKPIPLAAIIFAAIIGVGIYLADLPTRMLGNDCLEIYEDILPPDAGFVRLERLGETITVYHDGGEKPVICGLDENDDVDFTSSMNRKIDIMWDDPTVSPRFD
jgi:hypothetical protein